MKKIRIMHYVFGLSNGGVESVLLNYFSKFNLDEYSLSIVIQSDPDDNCREKFEKLGFKIYNVGSKKRIISHMKKIKKIIQIEKPDIIHCHANYYNFFPLFIAMIMKVPNRISHSHTARKCLNIKEFILKYFNKLVATEYMACGNDAAVSLFGKKNFESEKVYILNNAIDYDNYKFNPIKREKIRKELKIKKNEILVGNIGRFGEQKNQPFIIDIFEQINKKNKNYKLLLIGTGSTKEEIIEKVNSKNLQNYVIFLEKRNDIGDLLSAMDIFILPSLREGLPLSGLEAQASNLPCLFSNTITNECNINGNIVYLSITNGPEIWKNKILETDVKTNREINNIKNFQNHCFDINMEANKLDKYYKNLIEKDNK